MRFYITHNRDTGSSLPRCHLAVTQLKLHLSCQYFNYTLNNCFPIFKEAWIFRLMFLCEEVHWKLEIDTKVYTNTHTHIHKYTYHECMHLCPVSLGKYNWFWLGLDFIMPPTQYIWSIRDLFVLVDVTSRSSCCRQMGTVGLYAYAQASQIAPQ